MIKKIMMLIALFFLSIGMLSCEEEITTITVPNVTGMTQTQIENIFAELPLNITFETVVNNTIPEGRFVSYNDLIVAGDMLEPNTSLTIYLATHENRLPNLRGLSQLEILTEISKIDVVLEFQFFETNDIEEGYYVAYGNNNYAGQLVAPGANILIYIAKPIPEINRSLIISKYLEGSLNNRAIELYNVSEEDIDLSLFEIAIYSDGSEAAMTIIELSGYLSAHQTYVIAYSGADETIKSVADDLHSRLIFNGNDTIVLRQNDETMIDVLGNIGWGLFYLDNRTLIRKTNIQEPSVTFDIEEWDTYAINYVEPFGSHPVTYPVTFTFNQEYLSIPFSEPYGMIEVEFVSNNDGDTAQFTPGFLYENRVRFIGIDTPETGSGIVATNAKNFVGTRLSQASIIYLMHDPVSGNVDTYGRYLALIWVDGSLLNYEIVLNGYSQNNYQDSTQALIFNGIPLARWMTNAESYAKSLGLGVWGS